MLPSEVPPELNPVAEVPPTHRLASPVGFPKRAGVTAVREVAPTDAVSTSSHSIGVLTVLPSKEIPHSTTWMPVVLGVATCSSVLTEVPVVIFTGAAVVGNAAFIAQKSPATRLLWLVNS